MSHSSLPQDDTNVPSRPPGAPYSTARDERGKVKRIYDDENERYALPGTFDPDESDCPVTVSYLIHNLRKRSMGANFWYLRPRGLAR
jgi:hypothetical protein